MMDPLVTMMLSTAMTGCTTITDGSRNVACRNSTKDPMDVVRSLVPPWPVMNSPEETRRLSRSHCSRKKDEIIFVEESGIAALSDDEDEATNFGKTKAGRGTQAVDSAVIERR